MHSQERPLCPPQASDAAATGPSAPHVLIAVEGVREEHRLCVAPTHSNVVAVEDFRAHHRTP